MHILEINLNDKSEYKKHNFHYIYKLLLKTLQFKNATMNNYYYNLKEIEKIIQVTII